MNADLSRRILALSLRSKIALVWRIFRDPNVPVAAKALLPVVVGYVAIPFDIVPDDIPFAGQIDDLIMVVGALTLFLILAPRDVIEFHLRDLE